MMRIIAFIAIMAILYAISWIVFVGGMYLICLCFSWDFSVSIATGIWLIVCLIKGAFSTRGKRDRE